MRWISHIAIAGSITAVLSPPTVAVAVLGATAPDWLEWVLNAVGARLQHRAATHYLSYWAGTMAFALLLWDWHGFVILVLVRRPAACVMRCVHRVRSAGRALVGSTLSFIRWSPPDRCAC